MARRSELEARQDEIRARLLEIEEEHGDDVLPDDIQSEVETLEQEFDGNARQITHLEERQRRIAKMVAEGRDTPVVDPVPSRGGNNIYDLTTVRASIGQPDALGRELRERAMRSIEESRFGVENQDAARDQVARLLETHDTEDGELARRILATGSPIYLRAFGKRLMGRELTTEESRALTAGTGSEGGFAVPYTLDPTIILTSDGSVNPLRQIARVEPIVTSTWQGVTSSGVTVTRAAEAAEAGDDSPTLAQPEVTPKRVHAFIPFSIEIGQDWGALRSEMAMLLQEAKDDEEAASFVNGDGTGVQPGGIVGTLDAASEVASATIGTLATEDIYAVEEALGERFLARAQWLAHRGVYNRVRQFDTAGGADLWVRLGEGLPPELIGYPANRSSAMSNDIATGEKVLLLGDFRHFLIVDRVGMDIELVPHLFGANRRPTGQRGIYAFWRNTTAILTSNAFRLLVIQ